MATSGDILQMKCSHDIIGEQKFDCCERPKKLNADMVKKMQKNLLNMGGGLFFENKDEADEFLIKR